MASGGAVVNGHLGIVELVSLCEDQRDRNERLFSVLGGWVRTTESPTHQQLFAEAGHRHAWHAQLWADRTPAIPVEGKSPPADTTIAGEAADRLSSYRAAVESIRDDVLSIASRIDRTLDPGTARVIDLVVADLGPLHDRMSGRRGR